jgi:hypothetical protein
MTDINGLKIKEFVYNKVINSDCNYKNFKYHIDITDGWGNDVLAVLVELPKEVDISFIFSGNYEKYDKLQKVFIDSMENLDRTTEITFAYKNVIGYVFERDMVKDDYKFMNEYQKEILLKSCVKNIENFIDNIINNGINYYINKLKETNFYKVI